MTLADRAVELAEALLREARAQQTADERAQARKLARMIADPHGKELTIALADQAFRSHRPERIADQLAYLLERYGVPQYMDWWERVGLLLGGAMAHYLPSLVVPPIVARLRHETQNVILPGEEEDLRRYLEERRRAGLRLNLNQLGEAILGEAEAARRLQAYLALLARDDVEYISVKVSSVFSQIDLVAFRATVARVAERLRTLYRAAARHRYLHPDGRITPKFINLDMEEYRDLDLTVTAFREVLDEPEFLPLSAGIVLQAYLPDSHRVQRALTEWALAAGARGAARRSSCASSRARTSPWSASRPRCTAGRRRRTRRKVEVDANYKRMLEYGCRPEHAEAVHLGVASHNLFDIAYGLVLREAHGVERWVEFEMLEGMANHQARAVQRARRWPAALRARSCARRTSTAPSPTSCAGSTRTPRPRTSCATSSTSSRARPTGSPSAIASWPPSSSAARPLRRARGARRIEARTRSLRRARRPSARSSRTIPTPTGRWRPTARWIDDVVRRWRERRAGCDPAPDRRRASRGRAAARSAIPRGPGASPIASRWPVAPTSIAR